MDEQLIEKLRGAIGKVPANGFKANSRAKILYELIGYDNITLIIDAVLKVLGESIDA